MVGIIVCSHANLAEGLICAMEMICGPTKNVEAFCLEEGAELVAFSEQIGTAVRRYNPDYDAVVVCADLYGATPYNAAALALAQLPIRSAVLTGANLPLLLELVSRRENTPFEKLAEEVAALAHKAIHEIDVKKLLGGTS